MKSVDVLFFVSALCPASTIFHIEGTMKPRLGVLRQRSECLRSHRPIRPFLIEGDLDRAVARTSPTTFRDVPTTVLPAEFDLHSRDWFVQPRVIDVVSPSEGSNGNSWPVFFTESGRITGGFLDTGPNTISRYRILGGQVRSQESLLPVTQPPVTVPGSPVPRVPGCE